MVNALDNIAKQFDNAIVTPLREQLVGRKLIQRNNTLSGQGIGLQSVETYTLGDLNAAIMDWGMPDGDEDTVDITAGTTKMVYMNKTYKIPRTMYESYRLKGIPIDSDVAVAVSDLIAKAEDQLLLWGWKPDGTNAKVNGLYKAAGNTEGTADDFGTYGKAMEKAKLALALLQADGVYGPYNMTLNPTQFMELAGSVSTAGLSEWDQVMRLLNVNTPGQVGQIVSSTVMTAGTGMITGIGTKYFDYIEAQAPKNELGFDAKHPDTGPIYGTQYEAIVPRIKQTNAICTLTAI